MSTAKTAAAIGIQITADPKQATKALDTLNKQIGGIGKQATATDLLKGTLSNIGDGAEKLAFGFVRATATAAKFGIGLGLVGTTAAAIGFTDMAVNFATGAATVGRAADRLGMPIEKLSQLQIASKLAGSTAEDMTKSLAGLQATVSDAAYGRNNDAFSAFRAAGIDVGNAKNGAKSYAAMLPQIANEVQRLAKTNVNAAQRFMELVGVSRELFPVFQKGAAGLKSYMDQAEQLHPITEQQRQDARALEAVMTLIGERFGEFARIGGAAIAPGLTKFLKEFESFLAGHTDDVTAFFTAIEHGLEWLMTPKNLSWLHKELDDTVDGIKHLYAFVEQVEHSPLLRRIFGLPAETQTAPVPSIGQGIPTDDDGGKLERTLKEVDNGRRRGSSDATDPQSLNFVPPAPSSESQNALAQEAMAIMVKKGWSREQAAGIVGNLQQESSFNTLANNGSHAGIAQWDATRQKEIAEHFHKTVQQMSFREQLEAVNWELTQGRYSGVGNKLRQQTGVGESSAVINHGYEIPANENTPEMRREDLIRARRAQAASQGFNPDDPATKRFMEEHPGATPPASSPAAPGPAIPAYSSQPTTANPTSGPSKLQIEVVHTNPPPGSYVKTITADPSQIDVTGPKTMGAMPGAGTQRNVARDGY